MAKRFRLIALRHGLTESNRERRYQGCLDIPLSIEGWAQAEAAASALAALPLRAVYASPLRRTQETAAAIARPHALPVMVESAFREMCHGLWEGLTVAEVQARFPDQYAAWQERPETVTMPDGESLAQVRERVLEGLARLRAAHPGEAVCLVTHGVSIRLLILEALGLPPAEFWSVHAASTGISELEYRASGVTAHRINTLAHLVVSGDRATAAAEPFVPRSA
ncbi:MAG: histidine phosphatase family protein [Candidatus Methylomirabilia bacterium]